MPPGRRRYYRGPLTLAHRADGERLIVDIAAEVADMCSTIVAILARSRPACAT